VVRRVLLDVLPGRNCPVAAAARLDPPSCAATCAHQEIRLDHAEKHGRRPCCWVSIRHLCRDPVHGIAVKALSVVIALCAWPTVRQLRAFMDDSPPAVSA